MSDQEVCSIHNKKRTCQNLEDDGEGGMKCKEGRECNGGGEGNSKMMPGDWMCGSCGDHQFARNQTCRKCGAPQSSGKGGKGGGGKGGGMMGGGGMGGGGMGGMADMMSMMGAMKGGMMGGKGDMGKGKMEMMWNMMNMMWSKGGGGMGGKGGGDYGGDSGGWGPSGKGMGGSASRSGNPGGSFGSIVECSKHGKKRSTRNMQDDGFGGMCCAEGSECQTNGGGGSSDGGMKPGDWNCPACNDHQFARNKTCRKCGEANPNDGGDSRQSPYGAPY